MANSEFLIRQAENADANKIFEFLCELENRVFDYQEFYLNYRNNIFGNNNVYLVASDKGGLVVGYISCHGQTLLHHGGMVYEIQELFVEKKWRRKGIARLLISTLEERLAKRDYQGLEVSTNAGRLESPEFYRKYGFEQTHVKFTKSRK
ncbi:MAG TPA: GNAT family N-acetyltransferase [Puia sp.]|nr:GNAT family N-acetyltransferase [Puia sp.]